MDGLFLGTGMDMYRHTLRVNIFKFLNSLSDSELCTLFSIYDEYYTIGRINNAMNNFTLRRIVDEISKFDEKPTTSQTTSPYLIYMEIHNILIYILSNRFYKKIA